MDKNINQVYEKTKYLKMETKSYCINKKRI